MTSADSDDYKNYKSQRCAFFRREPSEEEAAEQHRKEQRFEELTVQDMRHFFRAGFSQINDSSVIMNCSHYFVYATPVDISKPLQTESEALEKDIARHPPPGDRAARDEYTGEDSESSDEESESSDDGDEESESSDDGDNEDNEDDPSGDEESDS